MANIVLSRAVLIYFMQYGWSWCIDLCLKEPREIQISECICTHLKPYTGSMGTEGIQRLSWWKQERLGGEYLAITCLLAVFGHTILSKHCLHLEDCNLKTICAALYHGLTINRISAWSNVIYRRKRNVYENFQRGITLLIFTLRQYALLQLMI